MFFRPTTFQRNAALLPVLVFLAACAGHNGRHADVGQQRGEISRPAASEPSIRTSKKRAPHEFAAITAASQVGVPYRYGGADESGFDCSGLVHFAYRRAGKQVPRTTGSLWRTLPRVPTAKLRVGDVLFFRISGKVSHVGMYLGGRQFVHAPQSGRSVSIAKLDSPYYSQVYIGAGRP